MSTGSHQGTGGSCPKTHLQEQACSLRLLFPVTCRLRVSLQAGLSVSISSHANTLWGKLVTTTFIIGDQRRRKLSSLQPAQLSSNLRLCSPAPSFLSSTVPELSSYTRHHTWQNAMGSLKEIIINNKLPLSPIFHAPLQSNEITVYSPLVTLLPQ